jgi:uncharacterized protein with HEPN domain
MNEHDETRLRDMLDAARQARKFIAGKTRADLEKDDLLIGYAVTRAIEIVGEAASRVSAETRAELSHIPWPEIVGMRNRVVHNYVEVDYDIVWKVASESLLELIADLEKLFPDQEE